MNKKIQIVHSDALDDLSNHYRAGNVREPENFIERAVILTSGSEIEVPLSALAGEKISDAASNADATESFILFLLAENERRCIKDVLRRVNGVIGGRGGAAEIPDFPVST